MKNINEEKITEVVESFKKSPIFNFSLGSKELFHSNFLSWFGNKYKDLFGKFFIDYLDDKSKNCKLQEIKREDKHIDLTLSYSDGQTIFIENKVKSIANVDQLRKYSDIGDNKSIYILLSFSKPYFFDDSNQFVIKGKVWNFMSYDFIGEKLKGCIDLMPNEYDKMIIKDYVEVLNNLIEIDELSKVSEEEDFFDFYSDDYKTLSEIRIQDFYLKKKHENLAFLLYQRLAEIEIFKSKLAEFGKSFNIQKTSKPIFVSSGMTRSLGLVDFKYVIKPNFVLGIQVQGEHYRMVVEGAKNIERRDILLEKNLWFDFSTHFPDKEVFPIKNRKNQFNKFGDKFSYKSVRIENTIKINELLDIIIDDIYHIEKNIDILKLM